MINNLSEIFKSFANAYNYFTHHNSVEDSTVLIRMAYNYRVCLKTVQNPSNINLWLDDHITKNTFILVDGPSCSGKSTLAQKLAKKYNGHVLDIDLLCMEYAQQLLLEGVSPSYVFFNFENITDEFIKNNVERLVKEASLNGPVILVGMYSQLIMRSIISITLGRMFENAVSIFCYDEDFCQFKKALNNRNKMFETQNCKSDEKPLEEYRLVTKILQLDPNIMGIGFNHSIQCNYTTLSQVKI